MSLRTFCLRIFQHCPLLASFSVENHTKAFEEFLQYKTRIPVRGAIMLNHEMDSVVLVKGWKKGANWSFPRGKINKDEDDLDCAIREVYEETGLDLKTAGLVPTESKPKYIEINMREQQLRLYVFRDVPMDTNFQPRTRKEISKIEWYKLSELPTFRKKTAQQNQDAAGNNKFYMVAPFLVPLKKWVASQKKQDDKKMSQGHYSILQAHTSVDEAVTEDDTWGTREGARSQIPPIETLDGATQELQRLLKVQPPTQGLQPAPQHQDKASALLSILQAKSAPISTAPPPQHQVQPSLYLHHSDPAQFPPQLYQHGPPPHMQPPLHFQPSEHHNYPLPPPDVAPRHVTADPAQLLHPRPSAPQVQQSVFRASSAFQQQSSPFQPQSQVHGQGPPPQQQHAPRQQPPLSGQSMALLNAFKRDTAKDSAARNSEFSQLIMGLQQTQGSQAPQVNSAPQFNGQPTVNQASQFNGMSQQMQQQHQPQQQKQAAHQQNLMNLLRPAETSDPVAPPAPPSLPSHPSELAGSSVRPGEDHRSALLGMFKSQGQAPVPTPPQQQRPVQDEAPTSIPINSLFISEKSSAAPSGPTSQTQSPGMAQIQNKQQQPHGMYPASMSQGIPSANKPAPASAPHAGQDAKKQLLSLFGNAQRPPAADVVHEIAQGAPVDSMPNKTRVSSLASHGGTPAANDSRRGSETPISPADESFLLGYLQSLTKR